MQTISYAKARRHLGKLMDRVNNDRTPILLTRRQGEPVVMISLADYSALEETAYLLRSPANARRLLAAMERLESGAGQEHALLDE